MKKILLILTLLCVSLTANAGLQETDNTLRQIAMYKPGGVLSQQDYEYVYPPWEGWVVRKWRETNHVWIIQNVNDWYLKRAYSDQWVIANRWGAYWNGTAVAGLRPMVVGYAWYSYTPQHNTDIRDWAYSLIVKNIYHVWLTPLSPDKHDTLWDDAIYSNTYY